MPRGACLRAKGAIDVGLAGIFGAIADEYFRRYGAHSEEMARIAARNHASARWQIGAAFVQSNFQSMSKVLGWVAESSGAKVLRCHVDAADHAVIDAPGLRHRLTIGGAGALDYDQVAADAMGAAPEQAAAISDHGSLRHVICAGTPMYHTDQQRALRTPGPLLVQYYGLGHVTRGASPACARTSMATMTRRALAGVPGQVCRCKSRMPRPDAGGAALFLASDDARFITGTCLPMDNRQGCAMQPLGGS